MTNEARIISALREGPLTDGEISLLTALPVPSVRRTRLHLAMAGTVVKVKVAGKAHYRLRDSWEHPDRYEGVQER